MKGLLDFLQAASNGVASNVSGPVDLIGAGLNKIGLNVGAAPVGGSEWMKRKGLMRDVGPGAAKVLGETAGLLGPAMVSHFAPQIAKGLLQVEANAMAPAKLNKEAGAIVWHGSPHKFDKFDASKIGTGEGAQAYGHGLYLAESPDVATRYRDTLTNFRPDHIESKLVEAGISPEFSNTYAQFAAQTKGGARGLDDFAELMGKPGPSPYIEQFRQRIRAELPAARKASDAIAGAIYKVDLPDEQIAKMLDWDKPLSQQAPEVQKALMATKNKQLRAVVDYASSPYTTQGLEGEVKTMGEAIKLLGMNASPAKGSAMLAKQGIPGIRYLDGGSRGAGAGTSNFVVFPGNEGLLQILERNGQAIK